MQSAGFKPSSLGFPAFIDASSAQFPVVNAAGDLSEGPLQGAGTASFPRSAESGSVDFVKVRGKHQLSFGYMGVAIDENGGRITPTRFNFDNLFTAGPDPSNPNPTLAIRSHPCWWVRLPRIRISPVALV